LHAGHVAAYAMNIWQTLQCVVTAVTDCHLFLYIRSSVLCGRNSIQSEPTYAGAGELTQQQQQQCLRQPYSRQFAFAARQMTRL
jgi:hypothetical protein